MNWLRNLMAGRYGTDQLGLAMLVLYFLFSLIASVTGIRWLRLIGYIAAALMIFRIFSYNHAKRAEENYRFLRIYTPAKNRVKEIYCRIRDSKTYRFLKCPVCKQKIRIPRGKGRVCITCQKCKNQFIRIV